MSGLKVGVGVLAGTPVRALADIQPGDAILWSADPTRLPISRSIGTEIARLRVMRETGGLDNWCIFGSPTGDVNAVFPGAKILPEIPYFVVERADNT